MLNGSLRPAPHTKNAFCHSKPTRDGENPVLSAGFAGKYLSVATRPAAHVGTVPPRNGSPTREDEVDDSNSDYHLVGR